MTRDRAPVEPFLRWAGGKRWLARLIAPVLRRRLAASGSYVEPFLGSGAMFFAVAPTRARLGDLNAELINAFRVVQDRSDDLLAALRALPVNAATYYRLRAERPKDLVRRAARFVYLNRTCYGGLHRENRRGEFNVPYGGGSRTAEPLWRDNVLSRAHTVLTGSCTDLRICDFEELMKEVGDGDVVFCDPTYRPVTRDRFDRYGPVVFGWRDQERLAAAAKQAARRGAVVLISNAALAEIRALYPAALALSLTRRKSIGRPPTDLSRHREQLLVLDPLKREQDWTCIVAPGGASLSDGLTPSVPALAL